MDRTLKNDYRKLKGFLYTIDRTVEVLQQYNKAGEKVCYEFNGVMLFSDTVDLDSAYKQITGFTKSEFEEEKRRWLKEDEEREKQEEKEAKAKIPKWIERGKSLIYPEKLQSWKKCVKVRAGDLFHGRELDDALLIMEMLDSGKSFEKVKETLDSQDHSGSSYGMAINIVYEFSKYGPEFFEYMEKDNLSSEDMMKIQAKKEENEILKLKELHS